ncbi:MAG TPA: hypothetical protein VH107_16700 [Lacipirellulaceae bacterium]|jgi:hypothetical protein|nr:hypothetical protein [Lacipirellulaceae bacterium]
MDQEPIVGRAPLFKRRWIRICGALLLLLMFTGGFTWWLRSGRVTATALFLVDHSVLSVTSPNNERTPGQFEFENLKLTQLALLQSNFVITAALRNPAVGGLPVLQGHTDPVQWLQENLAVSYPKDGCLLAISLTGDESEKQQLAAVVDAVAKAYKDEVIDQERQRRLVVRDMLSRSIDSLNIEIKRKFDEFLDIARESGRTEISDGQVLQSLAQKRVDRIDDEIMRLENQLAIDAKDAPKKATLIEQRLAQLRKNRDERWEELRKDTERSADLETRKRDLDQLQSIAAEMSTRLEWMDIDANAPDRIRQVQTAIISPQTLSSRLDSRIQRYVSEK